MKTFALKGEIRQEVGKKSTKAIRSANNIPCVLYGIGENVHFTVSQADIRKLIYTPEVFIVDLTIGDKNTKAIVKELQFHPVTELLMHVDFLEINEQKPVAMEIPVKLQGLASGVKAGGKLNLQLRKLKVKGIYTDFPENIVIDVTKLDLGKSIQVGDISVDKLEILSHVNAVICQVKLTRAAHSAAGMESDEELETDTEATEATEETAE